MIEVDNLYKSYGKNQALRGISFEVDGNNIYGLLGPNGAGKTTTLRILATLIRPDSGRANVAGYQVIEQPLKVRANLGIVNGGMGLYERLTGREILEFFGRFYGLEGPILSERISWVDDTLGIGAALERRVSEMSSGMIQKVIVARAILHQPPVLLLDEATRGLDVFARRALLDFVVDYKTQGKAVVYSTHVLPEAEEICDQVGFLYQGRLLFQGTVATAKERYATDSLERAFIAAARGVEA